VPEDEGSPGIHCGQLHLGATSLPCCACAGGWGTPELLQRPLAPRERRNGEIDPSSMNSRNVNRLSRGFMGHVEASAIVTVLWLYGYRSILENPGGDC